MLKDLLSKNKRLAISQMAFRARKVFGTFEKRAPGLQANSTGDARISPRNLRTHIANSLTHGLVQNVHVLLVFILASLVKATKKFVLIFKRLRSFVSKKTAVPRRLNQILGS